MQSKADLGLDDRKVILCLSYLNQRKGIQYLIEAFHKLDRDDTTLVIAGDGPLRQSLENQAARARNIVFTGYIDAEVKASYYAASDLFVLPTTEDPWGWVINEAMYYGLPVIVSDAAGGAELIDGNGFVVKSCDSDSLCEAIQALLDDDELRSRMASRSLELSRQMDPNSVVDVFSVAIQQAQRGMESCR
jgi:glycosyltransferase involved in cell wall biosynthesis